MNNSPASELMFYLLLAVPPLLQLLVLVGGILFAITRMRRFPTAAKWLIVGLTAILLGSVWMAGQILFGTRTTQPEDFVFYNSILSIMVVLASSAGLVSMIYAVFVSRSDGESSEFPIYEGTPRRNIESSNDSNPYSAPAATSEQQ